MGHLALRQQMAHEHRLDRLHVVLGGQVHHREIFVVELAVLLGRVAVAGDEMVEHLEMGVDVAIEVHRHEAGELQIAGIDLAAEARIGERHALQAIGAEPFDAALLGELVDRGRAAARVDRAAHQRHRRRDVRVVGRLHQRDGGDQRHRRLADAERVHAGAEMLEHRAQVVDVIVEIEAAERQRRHARVGPVGDVDAVGRQERLDRAAQQRRVMARHRRDDQQLRLIEVTGQVGTDEMQQIAERPAPDDLLEHLVLDAVDDDACRGRRPACRSGASSARTARRPRRCSCRTAVADSGFSGLRNMKCAASETARAGTSAAWAIS